MRKGQNVTIRHIAARAGVCISTVSRALRGDPRLPVATRERIGRIAKELKYRRHPLMAVLASVRRPGPWKGGLPLAFVTQCAPATDKPQGEYFESARRHALQLGYTMSFFNLGAQDKAGTLVKTLIARGVAGVVLGRLRGPIELFAEADWSRLAVVSMDRRLDQPQFHLVVPNITEPFFYVFNRVVECGYRRIGISEFGHEPPHPDDRARRAALLWCLENFKTRKNRVLVHRQRGFGTAAREAFLQWVKKERPDAVIGFNPTLHWWATQAGLEIPGQFALAVLVASDGQTERRVTGWLKDYKLAGETAVDFIDQMLRRGEFGVPLHPLETQIPGHWQEGETLPVLTNQVPFRISGQQQ